MLIQKQVEPQEKPDELERHRQHLLAAMQALQTNLEAQPRLLAIMASAAAIAPICISVTSTAIVPCVEESKRQGNVDELKWHN